jgi:hypothetical protein
MIKKKNTKDKDISDDNIDTLRSWIRRIEQSTNSLSSRLSAVEKRISNYKDKSKISGISIIKSSEGPIEKIVESFEKEKKDKDVIEVSKILDQEISSIQDSIVSHDQELTTIESKLATLENTVALLDKNESNVISHIEQINKSMNQQLSKIERRIPPTVKLGKLEIPFEITGITLGIFLFFAAILLFLDMQHLILSPFLLLLVGIIFILSALFKSILSLRQQSRFDMSSRKTDNELNFNKKSTKPLSKKRDKGIQRKPINLKKNNKTVHPRKRSKPSIVKDED